MKKVIVCDDMIDGGKETGEAIKHGCPKIKDEDIQILTEKELSSMLRDFFSSLSDLLPSEGNIKVEHLAKLNNYFKCEILVLDNNLSALDIQGARMTAESIAGYIRAFGGPEYIISLNRNPEVDFDFRFLIGDYQTVTDLALNTEHLSIKRLWTKQVDNSTEGSSFYPWYWPSLFDAVNRRRRQIEFVLKHLRISLLESLSFPDVCVRNLSRHARASLWPRADEVTDTDANRMLMGITFLNYFVAAGRSLPVAMDRERIAQIVTGSRNPTTEYIVAKVVAAELEKWIKRDVLGPQDILVDVPHLLMRMPFLLGKNVGGIEHWNQAAAVDTSPYGIDQRLYDQYLASARFPHDLWAQYPCFWWPELKRNEDLESAFLDSDLEWADVVFCEDTSMFVDASDQSLVEFSAEFEEGTWNRRNVAYLQGYKYSPRSRVA